MKPVIWIGSALKDLKNMAEEVQVEVGHSLREIQKVKILEIPNLSDI
jgi:phage-related protein